MRYFEITDKNGNITAVSKLEYIKSEMQDFLSKLFDEKQTNDMRKKPLPIEWNTRIYNRLETVLLKVERPMPNSEALQIGVDEFYNLYNEYCDLCCWIEDKLFISYYKTKPEFCAYCAITTEAFEEIKTNGKPDLREALNDIDTRIANSILISAENAEIKAKPSELRLTAKGGLGHKVQTVNNKEPIPAILITENSFPPIQITKMPPAEKPKMIKGKKGEE